ncbi:adenosylcobinamide-phosphate synthase CbiB [Polycladidibacter hongkongensis]|uniref:adenosylcobinamide-phosphate synthase CbiB n=1 Tax=Polycladidibacter hongkongensis TaxID=1647556 RepID=UPI0008307201|nr:adenosylcobinamide-phosphate synthase CbiB [Pseudovibrio hongkongensis]
MLPMPDIFALCCLALILDAAFGEPRWLWSRLSHPVVFFGKAISALEARSNAPGTTSDKQRKWRGLRDLTLLIVLFTLPTALLSCAAYQAPWSAWLLALPASVLLAQNSLLRHVRAVYVPLRSGDLVSARQAVAMIVGRNPDTLDEAGVSRAAIESCAENYSDGVIAPLFWLLVAGLPGLVFYKLINTADSMIGHKNERYLHYGWAAARLDDLLNLIPARLTGLAFCLCAPVDGGNPRHALKVMLQDATQHRSPNAGWPEAAMAASLNIALAGPRQYDGYKVEDPFMNARGSKAATPHHIQRAIRLCTAAGALFFFLIVLLGAL